MRFKRNKTRKKPELSTASLPDIVFILLFFFMMSTVMKKEDPKVETRLPDAGQVEKLGKKTSIIEIYIGIPKDKKSGKEPAIYAGGRIIRAEEIPQLIEEQRTEMLPEERPKMTIALKIDEKAKMGLINDVKQKLREANARKVNYISVKSNID